MDTQNVVLGGFGSGSSVQLIVLAGFSPPAGAAAPTRWLSLGTVGADGSGVQTRGLSVGVMD